MINMVSNKGKHYGETGEKRQILRRLLPFSCVVFVLFLFLYPLMTILKVVWVKQAYARGDISDSYLAEEMKSVLTRIIGRSSVAPLFMIALGVILGIYAFSYLFSEEKIDFYESQPLSRKRRFRLLFEDAFLAVIVPYAAVVLVEAVTLAALHQGSLLSTLISCAAAAICCYFISLATGILSVMLTGRIFVAFLMSLYLLLIEAGVQVIAVFYAGIYFSTSAGLGLPPTISPLLPSLETLNTERGRSLSVLPFSIRCLAGGFVLVLLAFRLYRTRPAESAGKSVLHAPVRGIVKVSSACLAGLAFGYLIPGITGKEMGYGVMIAMIAAILFGCVVTSGIIEAVYRHDVHAFFNHSWQMLLPSAVSLLIFFSFVFDWTGYDSYLPQREKVESIALVMNDEYADIDYEAMSGMELNDTDEVQSLISAGMANQRVAGESAEGYAGVVVYHMKDGQTIRRRITVPYTVKASDLDAVTGQEAYKEGITDAYSRLAAYENSEVASSRSATINYNGDVYYKESKDPDHSLAIGFLSVYTKEFSKQYCYSFARNTAAIGMVTIDDGNGGDVGSYIIYSTFTDTIQFLKDNGLYSVSLADVKKTRVVLTRYQGDTGDTGASKTYTDPDQMQEIVEALGGSYNNAWSDSSYEDSYCEAEVYYEDPTDGNTEGEVTFFIDPDKLPEFARKDIS